MYIWQNDNESPRCVLILEDFLDSFTILDLLSAETFTGVGKHELFDIPLAVISPELLQLRQRVLPITFNGIQSIDTKNLLEHINQQEFLIRLTNEKNDNYWQVIESEFLTKFI